MLPTYARCDIFGIFGSLAPCGNQRGSCGGQQGNQRSPGPMYGPIPPVQPGGACMPQQTASCPSYSPPVSPYPPPMGPCGPPCGPPYGPPCPPSCGRYGPASLRTCGPSCAPDHEEDGAVTPQASDSKTSTDSKASAVSKTSTGSKTSSSSKSKSKSAPKKKKK